MKQLLSITAFLLVFQFSNAQIATSAEDVSPLLIGEKVPTTEVLTSKNEKTTTNELFKKKNTVLIVYRGGWCPYCNRQLEGLRKIEDNLIASGYQIIAVSPDAIPEEANKYSSKYQLISDSSTKLIQNLGIAFQAPTKYGDILSKASKGMNSSVLPAPSVYIINKKSEILFEYISPDYKNRIDEKLLLAAAKALN
ncbi:redoxin domain-containing protein [Tenacibaculum sp. IB213877]|uniref:redoxin domain-containing protein n=1 Tax=Tenacibaculum sp. IB213877 TaxID=3097351 RepID=UPI002A5AD9F7|nr:redoxin domain-containing protein [Tenacibaculum sp. IB213877]MDY0779310.1 redoxin domain-containing protein [Tenacibaculum sp. IB213877]